MVSSTGSSACGHGAPAFDSKEEEDMYNDGFEKLLSNVNKYLERSSNSAGRKAAEKLKKEYPQLCTLEMIHLLASAGTRMWLATDRPEILVIQAVAEVIGKLEEELKGYSTTKHELNKSFKQSSGLSEAAPKNLKKFFVARVPCQCLQQPTKKQPTGCCAFVNCGIRRSLVNLHACAACRSVLYCSVECQRSDWPVHSQHCQRLTRTRKAQLAAETAEQFKQKEKSEVSAEQSDDDGSLAPDDLISESEDEGIAQGGSAESFGFDDLIGEIEDLLGESDAYLAVPSDNKRARRKSSAKRRSSHVSKLHASTSLIPSRLEMEKQRQKVQLKSSLRKSSSRCGSKSTLCLSASISSVDTDQKRRTKKQTLK